MQAKLTEAELWQLPAPKLVFAFEEDSLEHVLAKAPAADRGLLLRAASSFAFKAKQDQVQECFTQSGAVLLVGLGSSKKFDLNVWKRCIGNAVRAAAKLKLSELALSCPLDRAAATIEAAILASYKFERKSEPEHFKLGTLIFAGVSKAEQERYAKELRLGRIYGECTVTARELIDTPACIANPDWLAEKLREFAKRAKARFKLYDAQKLKALGAQALLAVGSGSQFKPRLVVIERAAGRGPWAVLIGKGVCFDAGGLNIKDARAMEEMKTDKAGAVVVAAAVEGAARLGLKLNIAAFAPIVENVPSGTSFKPGDLLKTACGKTIEVLNTDAEGRLILADAICIAQRYKPRFIIDIATLTGACIVALGNQVAGLMSNDQELARALIEAGEATGERLWQLPTWDEYDELIKSEVADVKNVSTNLSPAPAGAIVGAKFLQKFVSCPWAHLDIAGPARSDTAHGILPKGATAFGVRLLLEFLQRISKKFLYPS